LSLHQNDLKPAHVLNLVAGFTASVMIHAEYFSLPCLLVTAVLDSHFVTDDTLKAFESVTKDLLGLTNIKFDSLTSLPGFKFALKQANTRENTIFT
jgi:hypothetical protein